VVDRGTADRAGNRESPGEDTQPPRIWYTEAPFRRCAIVNAATDSRGDHDAAVTELSRAHLQRYRNLLEERLAEITPSHEPARLARQLLLLIEGATTVAAIDGTDQPGADAHAAAAVLVTAAMASGPRSRRARSAVK
jgi:hypothetical protein